MAVFDCFPFFNELDVLEIRLGVLAPVVDRFVLVEADRTHSGQPKPLHFADNRRRFAPYLDRIEHVVVRDLPDSPNPWHLEVAQRDAVLRGLGRAAGDDLVMVSDVDEVPRPELVARMRALPHDYFAFRLATSYFRLNFLNLVGHPMTVWTTATRRRLLDSPDAVRKMLQGRPAADAGAIRVFANAGWHMSFLGDRDHAVAKIRAYAHQEANVPGFLAQIDVDRLLAAGDDIFRRPGWRWRLVPFAPNRAFFPRHVVDNLDRYGRFIG